MAGLPRVLVIDDDPLFRNLVAGLLKNICAVSTAETGIEGLERAMEKPPHVALIDVQMPDWNGIETLRSFRTRPELALTKTAMLTADATRRTVLNAIQNGADDYIVKTNFNRHELLTKLDSLLARSSLPLEDGERLKGALGKLVLESRIASAPAMKPENEWDPRLQGIIDHWE